MCSSDLGSEHQWHVGVGGVGQTEQVLQQHLTGCAGEQVVAAQHVGDVLCGVVDHHLRAFGYERLLVVDGSVMPANPGVNPSLTITALAEHAMAQVPAATAAIIGQYFFKAVAK